MNPEAKLFFEENPGEKYWYYSANLRVPNPRLKPWLDVPRVPWGLTERGVIGFGED